MLDYRRFVPLHKDGDNIKTSRSIEEIVSAQILLSDPADLPLLFLCDRLKRRAKRSIFSGFHLDKNQSAPVFRDYINFSAFLPIIPYKNFIALALQKDCSKLFTRLAEYSASFRQIP